MTRIVDLFDRADAADLGSNWIVDGGSFAIASGKAESSTVTITNRVRHVTQLETINHSVRAVIGGKGIINCGELTARQATVSSTLYSVLYHQESAADGIRLRRVVGGSVTNLATYASGTGPHTIELRVTGTNPVLLTLIINGTENHYSDSNAARITSGLYVGMRATSNNGGRFLSFCAEDLATNLSRDLARDLWS